MVRLRMYQLFEAVEMGPDGNMIFVLDLKQENRFKIRNAKC